MTIFMPKLFSTHRRLQAYTYQFTTFHFCNMVYLQHGSIYYCVQNNVTVTKGVREEEFCQQSEHNNVAML